jgi:hypothetical protein
MFFQSNQKARPSNHQATVVVNESFACKKPDLFAERQGAKFRSGFHEPILTLGADEVKRMNSTVKTLN